ncbi:MAG TPA: sulfite exporter TauE/SafE family protein [Allosphingosinicella sp.]|nr:sulfite exporter TauE/SafE family protein [Allosphingosinicella sp.]
MSALHLFLLFLAAIGAGAFNALAGGGSIFTFPALMAAGVPPLAANVTNTVALCPGYVGGVLAQRRDLQGQGRRMALLLPVAAAGGLAGALLLTRTSEKAFESLVPALVLAACGLLAAQERVRAMLTRRSARIPLAWAVGPVFVAAIYGGYFGAGLSVVFLAMIGLAIDEDLTRLNALKQAMALVTNIAAALFFAATARIAWPAAAAMAVGALLGGAAGGRLASVVRPFILRVIVIAVGLLLAAYFIVH